MATTSTRERRHGAPRPISVREIEHELDALLEAVAADLPPGPEGAPRPLDPSALLRRLGSLNSSN